MILFLSHSLGIVTKTEQDLIACSAILFLDPFFESYNFLFGTTITSSFFSSNSHFFSSQNWHASSYSIVLYLWLGAERPTTQTYNSGMVSRYYLGWPLCLLRGNSASENLQQETQWPKCCLYKTPYIAAPVRETGKVIARTPPYAWLPTNAPTRTRFFLVHE
jgi:hypothetical protein